MTDAERLVRTAMRYDLTPEMLTALRRGAGLPDDSE